MTIVINAIYRVLTGWPVPDISAEGSIVPPPFRAYFNASPSVRWKALVSRVFASGNNARPNEVKRITCAAPSSAMLQGASARFVKLAQEASATANIAILKIVALYQLFIATCTAAHPVDVFTGFARRVRPTVKNCQPPEAKARKVDQFRHSGIVSELLAS